MRTLTEKHTAHVQERTAREGIEETDGIPNLLSEPGGKVFSVDTGYGQLGSETDHDHHQKGKKQFLSDVLDLEDIFYRF